LLKNLQNTTGGYFLPHPVHATSYSFRFLSTLSVGVWLRHVYSRRRQVYRQYAWNCAAI